MVLAVRMKRWEILRKLVDLIGNIDQRKVIIIAANLYAGITKEQTLF